MLEEESFEELHKKYKPMIFHIIRKLYIYKNKSDFYQVGCIALWEAKERFDPSKGEFKSYAYAYILGRLKSELTKESKNADLQYESTLNEIIGGSDDEELSHILSNAVIENFSVHLTSNQEKWLKGYCLCGKTPSDIAKEERVSIAAVKAWRRDALKKLRKLALNEI